jgi:hypothetical protein
MKEIIAFLKDIFMIDNTEAKVKIGLSQFKSEKKQDKPAKQVTKLSKEVKLSDLMRRSA